MATLTVIVVVIFVSNLLSRGEAAASNVVFPGSTIITRHYHHHHQQYQNQGDTEQLILILQKVRDRGVKWLMSQATEDFGWPSGDTANVVVALASASEDWPSRHDLVDKLIVKQLEIELLEKLFRNEVKDLTPSNVARFVLALTAACKDPHDFYGHNLVASLERHHESHLDFPGYPETFEYSLTSLSSCLAGSHPQKKRTRHLLEISKDYSSMPFSIDTRSLAILALECVRHRKKGEILSHHVHQSLLSIGQKQEVDGSFGNVHSTAMAIQALAGSTGGSPTHTYWNRTKGAYALSKWQEPNGSFLNNIVSTADGVVAASALLNGLGVLRLRKGHCATTSTTATHISTSTNSIRRHIKKQQQDYDSSETFLNDESFHRLDERRFGASATATPMQIKPQATTTSAPTTTTAPPKPCTIQYWLWIGPVQEDAATTTATRNLTIQVPFNTTFFFAMQRAAELNENYEFSSALWPNGHYIHTIGGRHEEPVGYNYWVLYILKHEPDLDNPPLETSVAQAGVDDLIIEDGQIYLFWYKRI